MPRARPEQLDMFAGTEYAPKGYGLTGLSIRMAREERGLSGRALAELAGVDAMTLHRIEHGEQECTTRTLARIAIALESPERVIRCAAHGVEPGSFEELRDLVPWPEDEHAQAAVALHPDGLTGAQVAELLQLSPGWVDTVQAEALAKLRTLAAENTPEGAEARRWIELVIARVAERTERESARDWMTGGDGDE